MEKGVIRLAVINPVSDNRVTRERNGNKLALDNIMQRLQLEWPGRSSVDVAAAAGSYSVTLTFPYSTQEQS
jgi:two-component system, LytTR family, sensor histidine kinase AlgZ